MNKLQYKMDYKNKIMKLLIILQEIMKINPPYK